MEKERQALLTADALHAERVYIVNSWVQHALVERALKHGLDVPSPLQSQLFARQYDGIQAFMQVLSQMGPHAILLHPPRDRDGISAKYRPSCRFCHRWALVRTGPCKQPPPPLQPHILSCLMTPALCAAVQEDCRHTFPLPLRTGADASPPPKNRSSPPTIVLG